MKVIIELKNGPGLNKINYNFLQLCIATFFVLREV